VFGRYAALAPHPASPGPARNLLLDLTDLADQYVNRNTKLTMIGDELCVDRTGDPTEYSGRAVSDFTVTINDTPYVVGVTYKKANNRYRLDCDKLDQDFSPVGQRTLPLVRAINETHAFTIIPDDRDLIYVHGSFYAPGLKFGKRRFKVNAFYVGHCLYPATTFKERSSEKGDTVVGTNDYHHRSLFGLIDSWKDHFDTAALHLDPAWSASGCHPEPLAFTPTLCVCDDMVNECADFILADEVDRRVVLVHAKASKDWRQFSASAVQEVCAQAQKNTSLFSTYSLRPPPNLRRWDRPHKFNGLTVRHRIRKPTELTASRVWSQQLEPLLYNPLTSREIWLVLGNMLSASTMLENLRSDDPKPEVLQLNHLLQTTIAAAGSVGARTRIFCAP
jgi:hypothetical protein